MAIYVYGCANGPSRARSIHRVDGPQIVFTRTATINTAARWRPGFMFVHNYVPRRATHDRPVQFVLFPFGGGLCLHALPPFLLLTGDLVSVGVFGGVELFLPSLLVLLVVRHLSTSTQVLIEATFSSGNQQSHPFSMTCQADLQKA